MKWTEVFDKYFINKSWYDKVLVFIPGTYKGDSIRYFFTTVEALENGLDFQHEKGYRYDIQHHEVDLGGGTPSWYHDWKPIKIISQQERVCRKIKLMEERWKKFQTNKKAILAGNKVNYIILDDTINYSA